MRYFGANIVSAFLNTCVTSGVLDTYLASGIPIIVWPQMQQKFSAEVVNWDMEQGRAQLEAVGQALRSFSDWWLVSYLGSLELAWPWVKGKTKDFC